MSSDDGAASIADGCDVQTFDAERAARKPAAIVA
jgi:hypothetical protein